MKKKRKPEGESASAKDNALDVVEERRMRGDELRRPLPGMGA
jgi:hypothetical protein